MVSTMACLYDTCCCSSNGDQYYCCFSARSATKLNAMKRFIFMDSRFGVKFNKEGSMGSLFGMVVGYYRRLMVLDQVLKLI